MARKDTTANGVIRRGDRIYEKSIRKVVEKKHRGKFLAIDVQSGDYEIDEDDLVAEDRLLERHPDALMYLMRIGYPAAFSLGGALALRR